MVMALLLLLSACKRERKTNQLEKWLPDPEKIVKARTALALTEQQQQLIESSYRQGRIRYDSLQREAQAQTARLEAILKKHPTHADSAGATLKQLLTIENEIKLLRLTVYIYCKNQLTEEQLQQYYNTLKQ